MAAGDAVAADVPGIYDVVINGKGYMFLEKAEEGTKARYGYTKTFVERQNVSGNYGDNEEDFYLTVTQKDWSGGEGQRYFRQGDQFAGSESRYYSGGNNDNSVVGAIALPMGVNTLAGSRTYVSCCPSGSASGTYVFSAATSTNLIEVKEDASLSDRGTHGLGAAPSLLGMCNDGTSVYMTTETAGTVGIRKWNGSTFSTFSATSATSICFLNNTLYGVVASDATLKSYSTAGVATTVYTWQDAAGAASTWTPIKVIGFGGKILVLWKERGKASLWQYDGSSTSIVATFPLGFVPSDMCESQGVVFVSGNRSVGATTGIASVIPVIYFYANGVMDVLWSPASADMKSGVPTVGPTLTPFGHGIAIALSDTWSFTGPAGVFFYNLQTGSFTNLYGNSGVISGSPITSSSQSLFVAEPGNTLAYTFPKDGYSTNASTVVTSLFDLDSSQRKYIKSVTIDWDGVGEPYAGTPAYGSVDISYQLEGITNTWTALATAVVSGTETSIGVSGNAIAFKLTLNGNVGLTGGPRIRRIRVRAAPVLNSFRKGQYILDLAGTDAKGDPQLRNGRFHPLSGLSQANNLVTAATATTPFSITDRFGTFTGIIEPSGFEIVEIAPEEYIGIVPVRQV